MKNRLKHLCAYALFVLLGTCFSAYAAPYDQEVEALRTGWAVAKFQTPRGQQIAAFESLIQRAERANAQYPRRPEVMMWYGTILSTYASIRRGMGVLPHIRLARSLLEGAIAINSGVGNGFAHGVLGALYARAPGWPLAFGDKNKARRHLLIALKMDPKGSDANYYYGDFLADNREYREARMHLDIAMRAPIRKGYEIQDRGRKREIAASLAKLR